MGFLLLLLAGMGLGHTLLVMTRSEFFVSRARWDVLTSRLAAEVGRGLTSQAMTGVDALPWGEGYRWDPRPFHLGRDMLQGCAVVAGGAFDPC